MVGSPPQQKLIASVDGVMKSSGPSSKLGSSTKGANLPFPKPPMTAAASSAPVPAKQSAGPAIPQSAKAGIMSKKAASSKKSIKKTVRFVALQDSDVYIKEDYFDRRSLSFDFDPVVKLKNVLQHELSKGLPEVLAEPVVTDKAAKKARDELLENKFAVEVGGAIQKSKSMANLSWVDLAIASLICAPEKVCANLKTWEDSPPEVGGVPQDPNNQVEDEDDDEDEEDEEDDEDEGLSDSDGFPDEEMDEDDNAGVEAFLKEHKVLEPIDIEENGKKNSWKWWTEDHVGWGLIFSSVVVVP